MEQFVNRLEFILKHYDYSASGFADKIGVQRSSLSHLLSGRNKPSLDFILKIHEAFPELNLYWIIDGSGSYLLESPTAVPRENPTLFPSSSALKPEPTPVWVDDNAASAEPVLSEVSADSPADLDPKKICSNSEIEQIVVFYKDGTFKNYRSR